MHHTLLIPALLMMTALVHGAEAPIANGDLDQWKLIQENPPCGQPANWSVGKEGTCPIRIAGLTHDSTYAAWMPPGNNCVLSRGSANNSPIVDLDFLLAVTDPGSPTARSFNLSINEKGSGTPTINLRMVQGNTPGTLTLQAFNGKQWIPLAENAFEASVYESDKNLLKPAHVYRFHIKIRFESSANYTISYGPVKGEMTQLPDCTEFQTPVGGNGYAGFSFISGMSQSGYAIDNVSVK